MNESFVTVVGNLVADPQARSTKAGKPFTTFRLASTTRRRQGNGEFVDGNTNYVNVVAFNALGANVAASLHKGEPVIVYGRLRVNQWATEGGQNMTSVEVDAYNVGHDLTRGQAAFQKVARAQFEQNDRLADGDIQSALHDGAPEGPDDDDAPGASAGPRESERVGPLVPGGFGRAVEDAETDPYVVGSAV